MDNKSERSKRELKIHDNEREYVTIEETANFLQINEDVVRKLIKDGILTTKMVFVEINGHMRLRSRIVRQSVKEYLNIKNGENK